MIIFFHENVLECTQVANFENYELIIYLFPFWDPATTQKPLKVLVKRSVANNSQACEFTFQISCLSILKCELLLSLTEMCCTGLAFLLIRITVGLFTSDPAPKIHLTSLTSHENQDQKEMALKGNECNLGLPSDILRLHHEYILKEMHCTVYF